MTIKIQDMRTKNEDGTVFDDTFRAPTKWMWRVVMHEYGFPMQLVVLCGNCNWVVGGLNADRKIVCDCGEVHHAPTDEKFLDDLIVYPDVRFVDDLKKIRTEPLRNGYYDECGVELVPPGAKAWREMHVQRFTHFYGEQQAHA